jgi:hypothetical protein
MKFGIVGYKTEEVIPRTSFLYHWNESLEKYFENKNYGIDVESIVIGIICVSENFEKFFPIRKPKYTENKIETHDGISVHIKKAFDFGLN